MFLLLHRVDQEPHTLHTCFQSYIHQLTEQRTLAYLPEKGEKGHGAKPVQVVQQQWLGQACC